VGGGQSQIELRQNRRISDRCGWKPAASVPISTLSTCQPDSQNPFLDGFSITRFGAPDSSATSRRVNAALSIVTNTFKAIRRHNRCGARSRGPAAWFYLASWGMYRGYSFLLQHTYTVHRGVIDIVVSPEFTPLRTQQFGASDGDADLVSLVLLAAARVRAAYRPFAPAPEWRQASDILV